MPFQLADCEIKVIFYKEKLLKRPWLNNEGKKWLNATLLNS